MIIGAMFGGGKKIKRECLNARISFQLRLELGASIEEFKRV
jgi:hypothetical protein